MRRFFRFAPFARLTASAAVSAVLICTWSAGALADGGSPDIDDLRREIDARGWSFTVDDHFTSTLTPERRAALRGYKPPAGYQQELDSHLVVLPLNKALPSNFSWRDLGGVTPVRDQGSCGSCWAFAATAEFESRLLIDSGTSLDLSEQQVVSCNPYGAGCDGGWATAAYNIFQNVGAVLEDCHPYLAADPPGAPCRQDDFLKFGWITGYRSIANDVNQIKTALMDGPVCTGIDAGDAFEAYGGGCYDVPGVSLNHLVLIVGYDDRACGGGGAWLIKNSWGADYGSAGYIWVKYGAGLTGTAVTQLIFQSPTTVITVDPLLGITPLIAGQSVDLRWTTTGVAVPTVDIWLGLGGPCADVQVVAGVANTGAYTWLVPNLSASQAHLLVCASSGTRNGYGFASRPLDIVGYRTRYVSAAGSNQAPYESPATAAHTIAHAVAACTGRDTVLVAGGDYSAQIGVNSTVRLIGSWNSTFTVQDRSAHPTRVQAGGSALRFSPGSGTFGLVDNFVFYDCYGGNGSSPVLGQHGGAVFSQDASPTIRNCLFENNRAAVGAGTGYGGAVCLVGGQPRLESCVFSNNRATRGGAVGLFGSSVVISDCVFTGNTCTDSTNGYFGAAMYGEAAQIELTGGGFSGNGSAYRGGALYFNGGAASLSDVFLTGNRARSGGGGMTALGATLSFERVVLTGNTVGLGNGGGCDFGGVTLTARNSSFHGNRSPGLGGALLAFNAGGLLENCLFEGNSAEEAGGVMVIASTPLLVRNNVVVGNIGGGLMIAGDLAVSDWNNVWNNTVDDYLGGIVGANDLNCDPLMASVPVDCALGEHSPCIDRGAPDAACLDRDGSRADMGVHGGPGGVLVAPPAVTGAGSVDLGGGALRLTWDASAATDISHYVVYRDSTAVFLPASANVVSTVAPPSTQLDDTPPAGRWYYLVSAVDTGGHAGGYSDRIYSAPSATSVPTMPSRRELAIVGIHPNPFNPHTVVDYEMPLATDARLVVYDLRGRLVRELAVGVHAAGRHQAAWDGRDTAGRSAAAGVYVLRLTGGAASVTAKLVLAK